jgi:endo-1,4-beta-mannosidase
MYQDYPSHKIDRLRSYRELEQTFTLAKMAGLNPDFLRDIGNLSDYHLIMLTGGARLKAPEWEKLARWIRDGGAFYYSYAGFTGGVYAQNFEELFGCRQRIRFGQHEQPDDPVVTLRMVGALGPLSVGEELTLPRGPLGRESAYLPVEPGAAAVLAVDNKNRPAVLHHRLGQGQVFLATYPLEYMLMNTPDANRNTEIHRLYGAFAAECGCPPRFAGKHPFLEAAVLTEEGTDRLLVVVNHSHSAVDSKLQDGKLGQPMDLAFGPKEVKLFQRGDDGWEPIDASTAG